MPGPFPHWNIFWLWRNRKMLTTCGVKCQHRENPLSLKFLTLMTSFNLLKVPISKYNHTVGYAFNIWILRGHNSVHNRWDLYVDIFCGMGGVI